MTPEQASKEARRLVDELWVYSAANDKGSWNNAKQCARICQQRSYPLPPCSNPPEQT